MPIIADASPLMITGNTSNLFTATGPGATLDMREMYRVFTFNKIVSGVFSVLVVNYEGSLDGVNWYQLGTDNTLTAAPTFVIDKVARYVRVNVGTFTGGTNVAVTMGASK